MLRRMKLLVIAGIGVVVLFFGIVRAADQPGTWVRGGNPTLQKSGDLPDNSTPSRDNRDCTPITTQVSGTSGMQDDCVAISTIGLVGGLGVTITGDTEEIPIVPYGGYKALLPVPHQSMFITYSSAPVLGLTMSFYRTILDKIKATPDLVNNRWEYPLTQGPDFTLRDSNNRPLAVNTDTVAFSNNGNWMIADVPYQGFIRVNLATFEIVPFAPSVNAYTDKNVSAQVAISNDGRYAAIKPDTNSELKVYDIASCSGAVLPVNPLDPKCLSRDYWPYIANQVPSFKAVYHPRFTGTNQLSVSVMYDFQKVGVFKSALYTLTAPGVSPTGIEYLGMGDSYASGQGAFDYMAGTDTANNACHLSALSYPMLLSADLFSSGHSVACSGAKAMDIYGDDNTYKGQNTPRQTKAKLGSLGLLSSITQSYTPGYILQSDFVDTYNPQRVTLSIGGNDIGFVDIVKQCVSPLKKPTCYSTYEDQQELVNRINGITGTLADTYRAVSGPGRRVYVIGYPQIVVAGGNCADNVHLNDSEIKLFISLTETLNAAIARAAASAGVQYVDVSDAFNGHRMCETTSSNVAVNGLTAGNDSGFAGVKVLGNESYHPNALGHRLLERAILNKTDRLKAAPVITTTTAPPLPLPDAPKTGRVIQETVNDAGMVPDIVTAGTPTTLSTDPAAAILRPGNTYAVRLDADAAAIGQAAADNNGTVQTALVLPASVSCGYHMLHLNGTNLIGQPVDVSKLIFVDSASGDCAASPCGIIPVAGVDHDKDGIDDACDPFIDNPPNYKVYLRGSSIHAVRQ